jgi:hypothetical protein
MVILFLGQAAFPQSVEVLETTDTLQEPNYQEFIYLNDNTDISASKPVAIIRSQGSLKNTGHILDVIKSYAQSKGANSFRFLEFKKIDGKGELTLQAYFTSDSILGVNFQNIAKNRIYVFGDDNLLEGKTQGYKINDEKHKIGSGHYAVFDVKIGQEVRISKGGFTGMTYYVKGEEGKTSKFYGFSGFGIVGGGAEISSYGTGVGVNFTTGKIHHVEQNLALLLLKIYEEEK